MYQRDYHRLLFTASWIWYLACAGVGACLFPCITRAVFQPQPARSYFVKLEAVVARVKVTHCRQAWIHQAGAALLASSPRLGALGAW